MNVSKYYAVKTQEGTAIFTSWDECSEFIKGKKKLSYKAFKTLEEANDFISEEQKNIDYKIPTAYIDGSFDSKTGCYSFGGVLIIDGKVYSFNKKYEADEFSSARNVAGEIKGAGFIIQYCINHGVKDLVIYYDYEGIEKWYSKEWKASSLIAISYVNFLDSIKGKINLKFVKVKSHSNDFYNDKADLLAKEALGIK